MHFQESYERIYRLHTMYKQHEELTAMVFDGLVRASVRLRVEGDFLYFCQMLSDIQMAFLRSSHWHDPEGHVIDIALQIRHANRARRHWTVLRTAFRVRVALARLQRASRRKIHRHLQRCGIYYAPKPRVRHSAPPPSPSYSSSSGVSAIAFPRKRRRDGSMRSL